MSHYDSGHHLFPGTRTIKLTLETYSDQIGNDWKRKFTSNKSLLFFGSKFYIRNLDVDILAPTLKKYKILLITSGPAKYTKNSFDKLKGRYDNVILSIENNPIEFNTFPGWVRDYKKLFLLDEKKQIWSEVRDTIQNDEYPFEVEWYRVYEYWCADCHDKHEGKKTLLTKYYKSKNSALKASRKIPKGLEINK
jgi:hypothetical protein